MQLALLRSLQCRRCRQCRLPTRIQLPTMAAQSSKSMAGAIAVAEVITMDGAEVVATTMVGGIIAITGNSTSISFVRPLSWRPLWGRSRNSGHPLARFGHGARPDLRRISDET